MSTRRRPHTRWRRWLLPAAALVALAVLAGALVVTRDGADEPGRLAAYFTDAAALVPGSEVRADGVPVGEVVAVRLENGLARVEMALGPGALPLHTDAGATIRPVSLLGERYVSLDPGSAGAPVMTEPLTIPAARTATAVDLGDVLGELDTPTAAALAALVTTLGEGVAGNGDTVADAIRALAPALEDTRLLAEILREQNAVLDALIDQAAPVAEAVAREDGATVERLVAAAHRTLGAVAGQRAALDQALGQLPGTLRDTRETLRQLAGVADATTPVLRSARPATGDLTAIAAEITAFVDAGGPALASLRPVLDHAHTLLDQARPVVAELRQGSGDLRAVAAGARPVGTAALDNLDMLLEFVTGWALATAGHDGLGHYLRASVPVDANTARLVAPDLVPGWLSGQPRLPPPGPAPDDGSATGLNRDQELALLVQLLGGE